MKTRILTTTALCACLAIACTNNDQNSGVDTDASRKNYMHDNSSTSDDQAKERKNDSIFAVKAADGGMLEVELGKLAQGTTTKNEIREFARMMVSVHGKANQELKSLIAVTGISASPMMSADMQSKYDYVRGKEGAEFDKEYIGMMILQHQEDLKIFEKQAEKGKNPGLKKFAAEKVPELKRHLQLAESAKKNLQ